MYRLRVTNAIWRIQRPAISTICLEFNGKSLEYFSQLLLEACYHFNVYLLMHLIPVYQETRNYLSRSGHMSSMIDL